MFTLGTDPELICKMDGQFAPAHRFFKSNSSMGLDGCESTAEIRPGISESPIDLTSKIYQILEYGHEKVPEVEFYAGHYQCDYSIGGHIHFSVDPEPEMIEALDITLGSLSNCIDDKVQRQKRERSGYGKKGAYRRKSYGFEYRTPGSFLLSPAITLVTLTLAKLTVLAVQEEVDFVNLKGNKHAPTFLKSLKHELLTIPGDCEEGLKELDSLIATKIDWNQSILPFWGLEGA